MLTKLSKFGYRPISRIIRTTRGQYQLEYVKCNKDYCHCSHGLGHGPYWYFYVEKKNSVYVTYIGRILKDTQGEFIEEWDEKEVDNPQEER